MRNIREIRCGGGGFLNRPLSLCIIASLADRPAKTRPVFSWVPAHPAPASCPLAFYPYDPAGIVRGMGREGSDAAQAGCRKLEDERSRRLDRRARGADREALE